MKLTLFRDVLDIKKRKIRRNFTKLKSYGYIKMASDYDSLTLQLDDARRSKNGKKTAVLIMEDIKEVLGKYGYEPINMHHYHRCHSKKKSYLKTEEA